MKKERPFLSKNAAGFSAVDSEVSDCRFNKKSQKIDKRVECVYQGGYDHSAVSIEERALLVSLLLDGTLSAECVRIYLAWCYPLSGGTDDIYEFAAAFRVKPYYVRECVSAVAAEIDHNNTGHYA